MKTSLRAILIHTNPRTALKAIIWIILGIILAFSSLKMFDYLGISQFYHLLIIFTGCFLAFEFSQKTAKFDFPIKNLIFGAFIFLVAYL